MYLCLSGVQNGTSYIELTERYFEASPLNLSRFEPDYSQQCYDATWLLARGLNEVMKGIIFPKNCSILRSVIVVKGSIVITLYNYAISLVLLIRRCQRGMDRVIKFVHVVYK